MKVEQYWGKYSREVSQTNERHHATDARSTTNPRKIKDRKIKPKPLGTYWENFYNRRHKRSA